MHPFEGPHTVLGTATVGLEFCTAGSRLGRSHYPHRRRRTGGRHCDRCQADAPFMPGLRCGTGGCGHHVSQLRRRGTRSQSTRCAPLQTAWAHPMLREGSYELCRRFVDEIVLVDDDEMRRAMALLFHSMKLAVEPAGRGCDCCACVVRCESGCRESAWGSWCVAPISTLASFADAGVAQLD